MPKFSVIVPVYKVEPYLDKCIKSILSQTYIDFELLLVDDGSPDQCPQICDYYAGFDNRVKVIHKPNGGVTSARNTGVQNAVGDYLVFVDGDDFIGEELLIKLYTVIDQDPADVLAFGYTDYKDNTYGEKHYNNLALGKYVGDQLRDIYDKLLVGRKDNKLNHGAVYHYLWCKCIKRDFFWSMQKLIPKEIIKGEDAAVVMLLLSNCSQLYVLDVCEYYYRYVPSSAAHSFKENMLYSNRILYEFLKQNCIKIPKSNIIAYSIMMLDGELIKAAGFYKSLAFFTKYIRKYLADNFDDVLKAPLEFKMPLRERLRCCVLKAHCFPLYWFYYHRKKL